MATAPGFLTMRITRKKLYSCTVLFIVVFLLAVYGRYIFFFATETAGISKTELSQNFSLPAFRKVKYGMTKDDVARIMGPPLIVLRYANGWVYSRSPISSHYWYISVDFDKKEQVTGTQFYFFFD